MAYASLSFQLISPLRSPSSSAGELSQSARTASPNMSPTTMSPSTRTPPRPKGRHAFTVFSNNLLKINPINFMWVKNYSGNSTLCNKCSDSSEPIQSLLWIVGNIESHTLGSAVQCIQGWRGSTKPPSPSDNLQKASRTCPLCRAHSNFVVPSVFPPSLPKVETPLGSHADTRKTSGSGGEPKQDVIKDYLARLKKNALQVFRRERGSTTLLLHYQSHLQVWE
jgi:hypothetical protein